MVISDTSVLFEWNYVQEAEIYDLQISTDSIFSSCIQSFINIDTTYKYVTSLNTDSIYYWRVRYYNGIIYYDWTDASMLKIIDPKSIDNISIWLAADTNIIESGGSVQQWNDNSPNNIDATQINADNQPLLINDVINNKPVIRFDGTNDYMVLNSSVFPSDGILTIFFVVIPDLSALSRLMSNDGASCSSSERLLINFRPTQLDIYQATQLFSLPLSDNTPIILTITTNDLYLNSNHEVSFSISSICNEPTAIGSRYTTSSTNPYPGDIAEIIIYESILSDNDRQDIEQYLKYKYSPPVNLGPDIIVDYGFCDTILDAGGGFVEYLWSDGSTTQTISVNQQETYTVTVTDIFGYTSSDSVNVVYPGYQLTDQEICLFDTISWNIGLNNQYYDFLWPDASTDSVLEISDEGSYYVTITDTTTCSIVYGPVVISIDSFPVYADIGQDDTSFCAGNSVSLIYGAQEAVSYLWSDASTESSLVINTSGIYYLTVTNDKGCIKHDSVNVTITGISPEPGFISDTVCLGDSIHFTDTSVPASDSTADSIITWIWVFGDGDSAFIQNPSHLYQDPGEYEVELIISSFAGCCSSIKDSVLIKTIPQAYFEADIMCTGITNEFSDLSQVNPPDSLVSWLWDFGDGGTSAQQDTDYTYTIPGYYDVSLEVLSSNGCYDTYSQEIEVVDDFDNPEAFSLIYPQDQAVLSDSYVIFQWNFSGNATEYLLQVASDNLFSNIIFQQYSDNSQLQADISNQDTVYWRVIAFNICNNSTESSTYELYFFSPVSIGGSYLWIHADSVLDITGVVQTWYDLSGQNNNALQINESNKPVVIENVIYDKPGIRFDGTDDFMSFSQSVFPQNGEMTVFFVVMPNNNATVGRILANNYGECSSTDRILVNFRPGQFDIFQGSQLIALPVTEQVPVIISFTNEDLFLNSIFQNSFNIGPICNEPSALGSNDTSGTSNLFKGDIAEIIIYNFVLNNTERGSVEQYLRYKYSPPLNLGPDIIIEYGFCDTTIYAEERFVDYLWNTGETSQTITVSQSGTYTVTVTDIFGYTSSDSVNVVYPGYQLTDQEICLFDTISWNTGLNNQYYDFLWSDASTDSVLEMSDEGSYYVTITDTTPCSIVYGPVVISIDSFPEYAGLDPDTSFCAGNSVSLIYGAQEAVSYLWSDASTESSLTIDTSGVYYLTVTNDNGCIKHDSVNVTITGISPDPGFISDTVCLGDSIHFTDTSVPASDSTADSIITWIWVFGDGDSAFIQNPSHLYQDPGEYEVELIISSFAGCCSSIKDSVLIKNIPQAFFETDIMCTGITNEFSDLSQVNPPDSLVSWLWDFGDGNTASQQDTTYSYTSPGNYNISLTVLSSNGCPNQYSQVSEVVSSFVDPDDFTLIYPQNKAILSDTSINFEWNCSGNASYYMLQLSSDTMFENIIDQQVTDNTSLFSEISFIDTLYWRIIAYNICDDSRISDTYEIYFFSPLSVPDNYLWIHADSVHSEAGFVDTWYDISGQNNNATQLTQDNKPFIIDSALYDKPVVRFNGSDDFMTFSSSVFPQDGRMTVFFVVIPDLSVSVGRMMANTDGSCSSTDRIMINFRPGQFDIYQLSQVAVLSINDLTPVIISFTDNNLYLNSIFQSSIDISSICNEPTSLGTDNISFPSNPFKGDIAEIIIYDSVLIDTDRENIEQYLRYKYSPPVSLGPDIYIEYGFCDTVIYASERFISYEWNTMETTSSISVSTSGMYSVTVTDVFGFTSSDSVEVIYPGFQLPDQEICLFDTINWNTGLDNQYYEFLWSDASSDSVIEIYSQNNYYVTITDSFEYDIVYGPVVITVDSFPVYADLGPDDTSFCSGDSVSLTYGAQEAVSYLWSDASTESSLTIYNSGDYYLTVTNNIGCTHYDTISVTITGIPPTPGFDSDTACLGDSTYFTDLSAPASPNPEDSIISWKWYFGDNDSSVVQNPVHYYEQPGKYEVELIISSDAGCFASFKDSVVIKNVPMAYFELNTMCAGISNEFTDLSQVDDPYSIISWAWNFGDGGTSAQQDTDYTYTIPGYYDISLEVLSSNGCYDTYSQEIEVVDDFDNPEAFSLIYPQDQAVLSDSSVIFQWNFSGNATEYLLQVASDNLFSNIIFQQYSDSSQLQADISNQDTVYWRVIAFNICNDSTESNTYELYFFSPVSIGGSYLWIHADSVLDNTGIVQTWYDLSGQNNNALQINESNKPVVIENVIYDKPVIRFDGTDDFMSFSQSVFPQNGEMTVFLTVISDNSATIGRLLSNNYGSCSTTDRILVNFRPGQFDIFQESQLIALPVTEQVPVIISFTNENLYLNSILQNSFYIGPICNEPSALGSNDTSGTSNLFKGDIAEIIIYNSVLNNTERGSVEQYLRYKYSPPVNLGPDIHVNYGFCDTMICAGERFTDYIWSTGETSDTINVNSSDIYAVTVTDIFGFTSSDSVIVTFPSYNFIPDTTICLYDTLTWDTDLDDKINYNYLWQDSSDLSYFEIYEEGNYNVTIIDTFGCELHSDTVHVTVDQFPAEASLGSDTTLCSGNYLYLEEGMENASEYLWFDGTTEDMIVIQSSGEYSVTVTSVNGCIATDTVMIAVSGVAPVPVFEYSSVCIGDIISFTDLSEPPPDYSIINWEWNFGDGSTSTMQNPVNMYDEPGTYTITLSIEADNECSNILFEDITIQPLPVPSFSPLLGCSGTEIQFHNNSTVEGGTITNVFWDFDDGNTSSEQDPLHTYDEEGTYIVKITASSEYGCADSIMQLVEIRPGPLTDFSFGPACLGETVYFTDNTESQFGFQNFYLWDFGDGNTSTNQNPGHLFATLDTFSVSLTVTQIANGCANSITKNVIIHQNPEADFVNLDACVNEMHQLIDSSSCTDGQISSWEWIIENTGTFETQNPSHIFSDTGSYIAELFVSSEFNCTDSTSKILNIHPLPTAGFNPEPAFGGVPLDVEFQNLSNDGVIWIWDFGDGSVSYDYEPTHTYQDSGTFEISLITITEFGCQDTAYDNIKTVVALYDVAVFNAMAEKTGNYMTVTATLANFGSLPLTSLELTVDFGEGTSIKELWSGNLYSGAYLTYNLVSQYELSGDLPPYICVRADLTDDLTDNDPDNNEDCYIPEESFIVIDPFPNPASSYITIEYILPAEGNIEIKLFNAIGQDVGTVFTGTGQTGLNRIIYNTEKLSNGTYNLKFDYEGNEVIKRFFRK